MPLSTAQVLMRKGKRGAAAYVHADCSSSGGPGRHLPALLDVLLHPNKAIDEWETIDWCRWLIAGGRTPDEFAAIVRSYDNHAKCGLVWIPHVVAYRCRTCGISPCMSICRDCFRRGDHSTHDFNMFLSQAGGACDCGDTSVMKEDGFCSNHGINNCANKSPAPADLMCVAEAMMPRVILRLLQHFRETSSIHTQYVHNSNIYRIAVQDCEGYVAMLMEFNNMGELMRKAMTKALINPQMYRNMVQPPFPDTEFGAYLGESLVMYQEAIKSFPAPEPPNEYKHLPALGKQMHHTTLLEEFIFWTFKYEFPQNIVCFLLNMLPDQDYKEHLTRTFVMHYARIPLVLELSSDPDMLSNRVVHMSVQLFSNEALALRMVDQLSLLHVMVISLKLMMNGILIKNTLPVQYMNQHQVIDCTQRVMREHCYWPLVSDFNNVLSHKSVALVFLKDVTLIDMWFEFLSMLQGMNVNVRELGTHVEFEPSSYYAAFSCELEASAYPMWSIISHLTDPTHADLAKKMVSYCLTYLKKWLNAIGYYQPYIENSEEMRASFHFPLHRYMAAFVCQAVRYMGLSITELLPDTDTLLLLMMHPLRVQSLFYQIVSGIWVRNGLQIKGQAMTYIQANFCNSMVDMDIYFLQICASHLPKRKFLDICIETFGVSSWLGMNSMTTTQEQDQDAMIEGLLTFLAMIVSSRTNLGNDELTQSRLEISTLLASGDKTHSQLLEMMPERSGNAHTRNFETVLKELSHYRSPPRGSETLEQGLFVPKPIVWSTYYDPLHVLLRSVYRREFQNSMDRFGAYVKSAGLAPKTITNTTGTSGTGTNSSGALWPPLRPAKAPPNFTGCDPRRITSCGLVHAAILSILHRAAHRRKPPSEHVLALAVYLLEVAVDYEKEVAEKGEFSQEKVSVCQYNNGKTSRRLLDSFPGDRLTENACITLGSIPPPTPPPTSPTTPMYFPASYNSDSDTEWDDLEIDSNVNVRDSNIRAAIGAPSLSDSSINNITNLLLLTNQPNESEQEEEDLSTAESLVRTIESVDRDGVMIDSFSIREEDDIIFHDINTFPLALPSTNTDEISNSQMTVALPGDMSVVPTTQDVTELFPLEASSSSTSTGSNSALAYLSTSRAQPAPPPPESIPTTAEGNSSTAPNTVVKKQPNRSAKTAQAMETESQPLPINESIISLLLKLHSQLSGCLDSFSLEDENSSPLKQDFGKAQSKDEISSSDESKMEDIPCDSATSSDSNQGQSNCDNISQENRIGDGPYFIGNLLRKLCTLDSNCAQELANVRSTLWPKQRERQAEQKAKEQREREERTRKAKERQKKLMEDFANKQNAFMKRVLESEDGDGMEWDDDEEEVLEKEYDCIICNTTSPSTENNPIGLVVLLQSTSVVGHRRRKCSDDRPALALNDAERAQQLPVRDAKLAADHFKRHLEMDEHFDASWLVSVNVGSEGGVHVQSCGHHVHLACLQAYLRSLTNPQRPYNLHIDRGEFLCPVCRQLANSVLPLSPQLGCASLARCQSPDTPTLVSEITNFLKDIQWPPASSNLSDAIGKAMEDMTNSTQLRYKPRGSTPSHQALFLFVSSVARTNLEAELVQRGGSLVSSMPRYKPHRDCIVPLLHVLAVHARVLAQWPASAWWQQLSSIDAPDTPVTTNDPSSQVIVAQGTPAALAAPLLSLSYELMVVSDLALVNGSPQQHQQQQPRELPLMLRDPISLLIHFLLLSPLHLELSYLTCMIRVLYNLTYYQVVTQILLGLNSQQREWLQNENLNPSNKKGFGLVKVLQQVLQLLNSSNLLDEDESFNEPSTSAAATTENSGNINIEALELQVQELCLPFLRIAALLRHHLYGQDLPEICQADAEFVGLIYYLELLTDGMQLDEFEAYKALHWGGDETTEMTIISRWTNQLNMAATRCPAPTRRLLMQHYTWLQPALLTLPREYDRLFTYYHERVCLHCGSVPKEASVCLLCGTVVCLKQQCCRQLDVCEAVQHSIDCGGGTGIFLVVTSTYIVIVRGRRACLWGSLYLDDYDEEDRDLKRGKPLYLSQDRFELLEQQWLAHRFDHTKRTWVWHRDSL